MAAQLLLSAEPELIISLQGFPHQSTFDRVHGFTAIVERARSERRESEREIRYRLVEGVRCYEEGYESAQRLLSEEGIHTCKSAIFATNDDVAMGVLACLSDHAVPVPSRVAVVGYDDIPMAKRFQIPLTTIGQPIRDMGRIGAEELLRRLKDPERQGKHYSLLPRLVQRSSTVTSPRTFRGEGVL